MALFESALLHCCTMHHDTATTINSSAILLRREFARAATLREV